MEQLPEEASEIVPTLDAQFPKTDEIADILETEELDSALYQEHLLPDALLDKRLGVSLSLTVSQLSLVIFLLAQAQRLDGENSYCSGGGRCTNISCWMHF